MNLPVDFSRMMTALLSFAPDVILSIVCLRFIIVLLPADCLEHLIHGGLQLDVPAFEHRCRVVVY